MWDLIKFSPLSRYAQRLARISSLYYCLWHRLKIVYKGEKLNKKEHYLLVSNHKSLQDPPLLGLATGLPVAFIAKKELFENPFLAFIINLFSAIPINREKPEVSSIKLAKKALESKGWSCGIFIEGTRSKEPGMLGKPNLGAIFIAKLTNVPIVPIGITYEDAKNIRVEIGQPYYVDPKRDMTDQAWECLEKISRLCDYKMPRRHENS